jgi:hypothetical protein
MLTFQVIISQNLILAIIAKAYEEVGCPQPSWCIGVITAGLQQCLADGNVQAKKEMEGKQKDYKSVLSVVTFFILAIVFQIFSWILLLFVPSCFLNRRDTGECILYYIW